jgi:hypothetical protein
MATVSAQQLSNCTLSQTDVQLSAVSAKRIQSTATFASCFPILTTHSHTMQPPVSLQPSTSLHLQSLRMTTKALLTFVPRKVSSRLIAVPYLLLAVTAVPPAVTVPNTPGKPVDHLRLGSFNLHPHAWECGFDSNTAQMVRGGGPPYEVRDPPRKSCMRFRAPKAQFVVWDTAFGISNAWLRLK